MNRAYSLLEIKSLDEEQRIIEGVATSPTPDSYGDIVEPKGVEFKLPIPLLYQHRHGQPIGEVIEARVSDEGIWVKAKLAKTQEKGVLKNRLDEAWQSVKLGLVKGLSIGFRPLEYSPLDSGGIRFTKWSWHELSAVTIPANPEGQISMIRSLDSLNQAQEPKESEGASPPAATGRKRKGVSLKQSPVVGKPFLLQTIVR